MKTTSYLKLIVALLLTNSQLASSKYCEPHVHYLRCGIQYSYSFPIDTTVFNTDTLSDPFSPSIAPTCNDGRQCYLTGIRSYFNGIQIPFNSVLPLGMEGTLVDTFYFVVCTNLGGLAVGIMNVHIVNNEATGISENNDHSSGLTICPNPFSENISFALSDYTDRLINISIYDLNGRLVEQINNHFNGLSLKNEESGCYFYSAITENGKSYRGKIFKE